MKIAIFYICTGKYEMFWNNFYKECEKYFYPNIQKDYFVFTDSKTILQGKRENVFPYFQVRSGWPYDTLMRFQWFLTIQDRLDIYDFCYYFNANSKFLRVINESLINLPTEKEPLIFWCHTRHENDYEGATFHPERNPSSTAFVPEGQPCRCYGGGFYGGRIKEFMHMCKELRDNIMKDISNNIIAIWHDQSHIIKYAITSPHLEVPFGIISEEEYMYGDKCSLIFEAKKKYGGNDAMRNSDIFTRLRHLPNELMGAIITILLKLKIYQLLKKILHR